MRENCSIIMYHPPYLNLSERLFANSVEYEGHWIWLAYTCKDGYGRISMWDSTLGKKRAMLAHRVSYSNFIETIPPGFDVDHKCKVRNCVHPNHLQLLPWKQHRIDSIYQYKNPPR